MDKFRVMVFGFFKYRNLLKELVVRDIKVRYRKSVLGILWTVLNPLLMMLVITFVFSTIFKTNIPNFPVYFLTGNLFFAFNSEATTQAMHSINGNASLIKKVYIPKYLFPLSRVLSCLVNMFFSFLAVLIVMLITKAPFHAEMLLMWIPVVMLVMFTTGLSLILSSVTVFFRDIGHFYSVFILSWTYATPIFYPTAIIPESYRWLMKLNPMYDYIEYLRQLVLYGVIPGRELHATCLVFSVTFLLAGLWTFYKSQDRFILYI